MRSKIADWLMPWVARNATVWPSQHAINAVLLKEVGLYHALLDECYRCRQANGGYIPSELGDRLGRALEVS